MNGVVRCPYCDMMLCREAPDGSAKAVILCRKCKLEWYVLVMPERRSFQASSRSIREVLEAQRADVARLILAALEPSLREPYVPYAALTSVMQAHLAR